MRLEDKYLVQNHSSTLLDQLIRQTLKGEILSRTYPVHSLYFDTTDFQCYWSKREGLHSRYKIRLRHYGDSVQFLEWKIKQGEESFKERFQVNHAHVQTHIHTLWPHLKLTRPSEVFKEALEVSYERIEYSHPLSNLRLTLDQKIQYRLPYPGFTTHPTYELHDKVLEVKYRPEHKSFDLIKPLLNELNLKRQSLSKYSDSLEKAGLL